MKKTDIPKPQTNYERLTQSTMQDHSHLSTSDIARRRNIMVAQLIQLESEQAELMARMLELKNHRAQIDAQILGLNQVVEKR